MGRLALAQMGNVLETQFRSMEEQSRKSERAARFSVALVVAGIAVVSLLLSLGWEGETKWLLVVVVAFSLFFLQAGVAASRLIWLSTMSDVKEQLRIGPSPLDLFHGLRAGRYSSEATLIKSLVALGARLYSDNNERINNAAIKRDRFMWFSILSIFWLGGATLIYVLGGLL